LQSLCGPFRQKLLNNLKLDEQRILDSPAFSYLYDSLDGNKDRIVKIKDAPLIFDKLDATNDDLVSRKELRYHINNKTIHEFCYENALRYGLEGKHQGQTELFDAIKSDQEKFKLDSFS